MPKTYVFCCPTQSGPCHSWGFRGPILWENLLDTPMEVEKPEILPFKEGCPEQEWSGMSLQVQKSRFLPPFAEVCPELELPRTPLQKGKLRVPHSPGMPFQGKPMQRGKPRQGLSGLQRPQENPTEELLKHEGLAPRNPMTACLRQLESMDSFRLPTLSFLKRNRFPSQNSSTNVYYLLSQTQI